MGRGFYRFGTQLKLGKELLLRDYIQADETADSLLLLSGKKSRVVFTCSRME
jgi:hypothetical protein